MINIQSTADGGHRVNINPPEGADGCVMLIEKRSRPNSPAPQKMVVSKKKAGQNAGFISTQPKPQVQA